MHFSGQMVFCVVVDFPNAQAFLFSAGWQRISEPYVCRSAFGVSVLAAGFLCQTPVEALRLFSGLGSMVDSLWEQPLTQ